MKSNSKKLGLKERPTLVIVHPNMHTGGAERQIVHFLKYYNRSRLRVVLLLYENNGMLMSEVESIPDQEVLVLSSRHSYLGILRLICIFNAISRIKPDILYSFLVHSNLVSYVAGRLVGVPKLIWGLRVSRFSKDKTGSKAKVVQWMAQKVSRSVDLVISNNNRGLSEYTQIGVKPKSQIVIHNGIDTDHFKVNLELRESFRKEIGAKETDCVVCQVSRIVEWKGYVHLIDAINLLSQNNRELIYVFVGPGKIDLINRYKADLDKSGKLSKVLWLGERQDIDRVLNGIDIFTLASTEGEGFSNAVGEAMSTSRPVVVTDVGGNSEIVGSGGLVVQPNNSSELADAWERLKLDKILSEKMGKSGRERVLSRYSIKKNVSDTEGAVLNAYYN